MNQPELQLENEIEKLNNTLRLCKKVEETIQTAGWIEIIEPMLDKMIMDILGSKVKGKWYGGMLDRAKKDERREFYVGYKQALIDLHSRIMAYATNVKISEEKVNKLLTEKTTVRYTIPMVDDTKYGVNNAIKKR